MLIIILHFVILTVIVNVFSRCIFFNIHLGVKEICNLLWFIRLVLPDVQDRMFFDF